MGGGWTDFWRKNKRLCQFLLAIAAAFGIDKWNILWRLFDRIFTSRLFSGAWWTSPLALIQTDSLAARAVCRGSLFALVSGIAVNGYFSYRHRNSPLTLLSTSIRLCFTDGGRHCITRRVQRFRANRPGVRAYYMKMSPEAAYASIPREDLSVDLGQNPANQNSVTLKTFGSPRGWELVCEFSDDLPYSWYLPFIPGFCLRGDLGSKPKLFKKFITEQRIKTVTLNEYDQLTNRYQISANRYDHQSIIVELDFSNDSWKPANADAIQAIRRLSNAVFKISAVADAQLPHLYRIEIEALQKDEILAVTWDRRPSP